MTRAGLMKAIDVFLKDRRPSDNGGWAKITDKDVERLDTIIEGLVDLKCEADADGDRPIQWRLVDRRKGWLPWTPVLAYEHKMTSDEEVRQGLIDRLSAVEVASDEASKYARWFKNALELARETAKEENE